MASVPQQQGLPFIVEQVSSERVQMWASYVGQTSTRDGFEIAIAAFNAFWYESTAHYEYQEIMKCLRSGYWDIAVSVLDEMVLSYRYAERNWDRVACLMTNDGKQQVPGAVMPWFQDAMSRMQVAVTYRQAAASLVVEWCQQYQLLLPERTQAFLAERQG